MREVLMRFKSRRSSIALVAGLGTLVAGAIAVAAPPPMTVNTGARLKVLSPNNGRTLTASTLGTRVAITHFKVDCRFAGTANRKGIGHYHIELDKSLINMFCGPRASISMIDVKPGKHNLEFIPAANDHADDLKAMKQITFMYKPTQPLPAVKPLSFPGKPQVSIVSPKSGASVHGGFDLVVAVKNFRLSCALFGKANVKGYGHWHATSTRRRRG
jgi:hypothetical protein